MTLYLQRLLDRAAGPALAAGGFLAEARPALRSESPILAFDQRLGDPGLAGDFGIVGASPPEPAVPEAPFAAPADHPGLAPIRRADPVTAPVETATPDRPPAPAATGRAMPAPAAAPPTAKTVPHDAVEAAAPAPQLHRPSQVRAAPAALAPEAPDPAPSRPRAEVEAMPAPPATPAERRARATHVPQPQPGLSGQAEPAREPPEPTAARAPPDTERPAERMRAEPVAPAPAPQPAEASAPLPRREPSAASAVPRLAPVVAEPPPLAAPAAGVPMREVERIVDRAVRAALERGAAGPAPASVPLAPPGGTKAETRPGRPATAAEASVIGKLETSSSSSMLFGVRRR